MTDGDGSGGSAPRGRLPAGSDDRARAEEALRLVEADPRAAWDRAAAVLERVRPAPRGQRRADRPAPDPAAAAVAGRAAGLAALHLAHLDTAVDLLREAVSCARRADDRRLVGEAQMSLAYALTRRGHPRRALRAIDAALAGLDGLARTRARAQRGAVLHQLGRLDEALADYGAALPGLRAAQDWPWVARVHSNRAVLQVYRSRLEAAAGDLRAAESVCRSAGLVLQQALVADNTGFLHLRRGDVPAALRAYDEAERLHRELGAPAGTVLLDRSELLLSVRLLAEAREAAAAAVEEFTRLRRTILLPQAQLLLAQAALAEGDVAAARTEAERALRRFRRQERPEWAALARWTCLRCRLADPAGRPPSTRELTAAAEALQARGAALAAAEARLAAARAALAAGSPEQARALLAPTAAARRRGRADLRVAAWHGEALLRLAEGRPRSASAALRTGVRVLTEHQATLGATDLRAAAAGHREGLVALGLREALRGGAARPVLDWAERGRAVAALTRPVLPPDDPLLADALVALRGVAGELEESPPAGPRHAALVRRQVALERVVRDRARLGQGTARAPLSRPGVPALSAALAGGALVEYVDVDGRLAAVVVADGRARLRRLGPSADAARLLPHLFLALRRVLHSPPGSAAADAAVGLLRSLAARLDGLLLAPLAPLLGDRALVVVPTGVLQQVPWGLLPSCRGRPVSVAPSATLWHRAVRPTPLAPSLLAVAGPGLASAEAEARDVAALYAARGAPTTVLVGGAATVPAVHAALPGAAVAHLATHGVFRDDNPLFSSLRLADAPLTVYDLEALPGTPGLVVLAACESGQAQVLTGDELLGLAVTFLSLGTSALVASVVPVPDERLAPVMVSLHAALLAGRSLAEALAAVQERAAATPEGLAAAGGLLCVGAGGDLRVAGAPGAAVTGAVPGPTTVSAGVPTPGRGRREAGV